MNGKKIKDLIIASILGFAVVLLLYFSYLLANLSFATQVQKNKAIVDKEWLEEKLEDLQIKHEKYLAIKQRFHEQCVKDMQKYEQCLEKNETCVKPWSSWEVIFDIEYRCNVENHGKSLERVSDCLAYVALHEVKYPCDAELLMQSAIWGIEEDIKRTQAELEKLENLKKWEWL